MLEVSCLCTNLSELEKTSDALLYQDFVRPLDYNFDIIKGATYKVIGIVERSRTIWLYIMPPGQRSELMIVPAALFSFVQEKIPEGMVVRIVKSPQPSLEIIPECLAKIKAWYERYVDDDDEVVSLINAIAQT